MAIVTQYGRRITDRVVITSAPGPHGAEVFTATFDGEPIPGMAYSGAAAVGLAQLFLKQRDEDRVAAAERAKEQAAREQYWDDDAFLQTLADKLRIERDDLDRLIEIAGRRRP